MLERYREKRPAEKFTHDAFGLKDALSGKFIGCYQSPRTGVRFVKHETGECRKFETEKDAEIAASRQLMRDLDKLQPMKMTKEIVIRRRR